MLEKLTTDQQAALVSAIDASRAIVDHFGAFSGQLQPDLKKLLDQAEFANNWASEKLGLSCSDKLQLTFENGTDVIGHKRIGELVDGEFFKTRKHAEDVRTEVNRGGFNYYVMIDDKRCRRLCVPGVPFVFEKEHTVMCQEDDVVRIVNARLL